MHAESSEKHVQNSFGLALLDNLTDKDFLFFPVWNNHHFFLLVGRVSERRWEYYNSLNRDGDYLFAECYVSLSLPFMDHYCNGTTVFSQHVFEAERTYVL